MSNQDITPRITPFQQAAASSTGAVMTSVLVTPLDVVKTRLQTQQKQIPKVKVCNTYSLIMSCLCEYNSSAYRERLKFNGTMDAFVKISRNEGITSLWSGLSPTLILAIPATIFYFVSYEQLRVRLTAYNNTNKASTGTPVQPCWIPVISGSVARVVSVTMVSPLELIRTKMQSEKLKYSEVGKALKTLIYQNGIKGLWKGIAPTLLRDVPFSAVYWSCYENIKSQFRDKIPMLPLSFMAGAISGSIAATITAPCDIIKTHQQIEFGENIAFGGQQRATKMAEVVRNIVKENGIKGLYAGLTPRLLKVAPACAIMISSFEYGKIFFNRLNYKTDSGTTTVLVLTSLSTTKSSM